MKLTLDKILISILALVIIASLIIPKKYFLTPVKGAAMTVLAPIQKIVSGSGKSIYDFFSTISKISRLAKENDQLRLEKDRLVEKNTALVEAQKENEILRSELNFRNSNPYKLLPVNVIGKDPTNVQESLTIDAGTKDGLKEGMPVVSAGILVGKISEVHYTSSNVLLVTNPNSVVNAMLQESRAYGLVRGELGFGLVMESIPQETKINVGDRVITSGLGGIFPKGLIIGQVLEIISKQGDIFKSASLKPDLDLSKLEIAFVILGVQE
ncbi:MAG TPA: rod shape-determining protein MreC [Patescibacteria group bacterium]|nr:rod shape-determining protein MreC [Patescibacteria group bacterium]